MVHKLIFSDGIEIDLTPREWAFAASMVVGLNPDNYAGAEAKAVIYKLRGQTRQG